MNAEPNNQEEPSNDVNENIVDEGVEEVAEGEGGRVEELEAELAEAKDRMLRALAEAENTRKRSERIQADASKFAITGFAKDMLDIADNLRRAIDSVHPDQMEANEEVKTLMEGIQATQNVMNRVFDSHGIETVAPTSGRFDPNLHEVMFEADIPNEQAGTIIQLLEPGYVLSGRLLRPARVGVAKGVGDGGHAVDREV